MIVSVICSVLSVFFTFIALISVRKSADVITNLAWGHAHDRFNGVDSDAYVGVFGVDVHQTSSDEEYSQRIMYDSSTCSVTFCRTCHKYMPVVIGFLAAFILMALITMCSDLVRISGALNHSATQALAVNCGVFAIVLGMISLIIFAATCMKKFENYINSVTSSYEFTYGAAFGLLAVSVCLMFVDVVFNILVSADEAGNAEPAYGQVSSNNANPAAAPATAPEAHSEFTSVAPDPAPAGPVEQKEVAMTQV